MADETPINPGRAALWSVEIGVLDEDPIWARLSRGGITFRDGRTAYVGYAKGELYTDDDEE